VTSAELPLAAVGPASRRRLLDRVRDRVPDWFSLRVLAGSLAAGFAMGAVLVSVAWITFGADLMAPPRDVRLVIPRGTAALLAAGQPSALPSQVILDQDDHLIISNLDVATHTLGSWVIQPGQSITIDATSPIASVFTCSIHRSGSFGIIVQARPGLVDGILITLLVSVPIGLVLFAGATVFRSLDMEPEAL
jgi:hypothetical protein